LFGGAEKRENLFSRFFSTLEKTGEINARRGASDASGGPNPLFVSTRGRLRVVVRRARVRETRFAMASARVPSTVATSSTAHDTRVVSTTRAHTSSPVEKKANRKTFGGFFVRGEGTFETRVWDSVCVFSRAERVSKPSAGVSRVRTSPDGSVGCAEPAFAQALVPLDDDVVWLEERQIRALLVDLRDRLGELGVVLRRWERETRDDGWERVAGR
jgi:hypothetical protein